MSGCSLPTRVLAFGRVRTALRGLITSEVSNQLSPLRWMGIKVIWLVVSMAFGSGCAPFMPRPSPAAPADWSGKSFHPGDRLRVFTHDGRTLDLVVTAVTGDALVGEPPYSRPGVGTFKVAFIGATLGVVSTATSSNLSHRPRRVRRARGCRREPVRAASLPRDEPPVECPLDAVGPRRANAPSGLGRLMARLHRLFARARCCRARHGGYWNLIR